MRWKTPAVEEIAMSAEIGAYQDEFDGDVLDESSEERAVLARAGVEVVYDGMETRL